MKTGEPIAERRGDDWMTSECAERLAVPQQGPIHGNAPQTRRGFLAIFLLVGTAVGGPLGCSRPYRVGDRVLVEWGAEQLLYPAYIVDIKGKSRFRVHYEGYPTRWDEDISLPRIQGRVTGHVTPPPPPRHVRLARGMNGSNDGDSPVSPFKKGDRVRVRWRGSIYRASVLDIVSANELKVHYEGYESAWDEVIPVTRVATGQ